MAGLRQRRSPGYIGDMTTTTEGDQLQEAVESQHSCRAMLAETVPVRETFKGQVVWEGVVHVFDLEGHLYATRSYAWSAPIDGSESRRFYAVLHMGAIKSSLDAVRTANVAEQRNKEGRWTATASRVPTSEQFRAALRALLAEATEAGHQWIDVSSRNLHQQLGGYSGSQHRMPTCCRIMRAARKPGDEVLEGPPSGQGASLAIRYRLPRPNF